MSHPVDGENRLVSHGSRHLFDVRLPFLVLVILSSFFPYACGINHPATKSLEQDHQSITSGSSFKAEEVPANLSVDLNSVLQSEFEKLGIDPARKTQSVPSGNENAVFDLSSITNDAEIEGMSETQRITLVWSERLIGDYDQNGTVEVADITPIAQNYLGTISYRQPSEVRNIDFFPAGEPDGEGAENWRLARIDGDGNGEIGVSDIAPLAQHYLEHLDGYRVYRKAPGENTFTLLPDPNEPNSQLTIKRETTFANTDGDVSNPSPDPNSPVRYLFEDTSSIDQGVYCFKVAPFDLVSGQEGKPSNILPVIVGEQTNYPPTWTEDMTEPATQGRDCRIIVGWPSAIDPNGDAVTYSIYYDDDPIPPADYQGTLDEWLELACEPVDSTFKPIFDEETDLWSDDSVTPAEVLSPDDPRVLALNPSRKIDVPESGVTHDEIPLQVVSGLPEASRLNERDWGYIENQPGGFPPEPGANKAWVRQGPIRNVTAIPDYISPTVLTYYDEYTTEESVTASEPDMRERGRYYVSVFAEDDEGARSLPIRTGSFVIASAFLAVPLEAQFAPMKVGRNAFFRSNKGNIWTTFELDTPTGETGDYLAMIGKYNPDTQKFECTEIDRSQVYSNRNIDIVHEFDDGSTIIYFRKTKDYAVSVSSELLLVQHGTVIQREDLATSLGVTAIWKAFYLDNRIVLIYGADNDDIAESSSIIMQKGTFGNWDEAELIEEKVWNPMLGGVTDDRVDIALAVHKTELGDSSFERPQYIRVIRITKDGIEELYKNYDESGLIYNTFEKGSILRVSDQQTMTLDEETYIKLYFLTDTPRMSIEWNLGSLGYGYQETKQLSIQRVSSLGVKILADQNPLLREAYFLSHDPFLTDTYIQDDSGNGVFRGAHLDNSESDMYPSGVCVVFTSF